MSCKVCDIPTNVHKEGATVLQGVLQCNKCNGAIHFQCTRLPEYMLNLLAKNDNAYTCEICCDEAESKGGTTINSEEQIKRLEKMLSNLRNSVDQQRLMTPLSASSEEGEQKSQETPKDINRRKEDAEKKENMGKNKQTLKLQDVMKNVKNETQGDIVQLSEAMLLLKNCVMPDFNRKVNPEVVKHLSDAEKGLMAAKFSELSLLNMLKEKDALIAKLKKENTEIKELFRGIKSNLECLYEEVHNHNATIGLIHQLHSKNSKLKIEAMNVQPVSDSNVKVES